MNGVVRNFKFDYVGSCWYAWSLVVFTFFYLFSIFIYFCVYLVYELHNKINRLLTTITNILAALRRFPIVWVDERFILTC